MLPFIFTGINEVFYNGQYRCVY